MSGIVVVIFIIVCAVTGLLLLLRNLFARNAEPLPPAEWLQNFSPARYRPMMRLLADDDYEFMVASGGDPAVVRRLRSERRRIFRAYLSNLIRDFNRVHRAARLLLVESEQDQPEIAARLIRIRYQFFLVVMAVRIRLALHAVGVGVVDVRGLLNAVESVRMDLGSLQPNVQPASI